MKKPVRETTPAPRALSSAQLATATGGLGSFHKPPPPPPDPGG